MPVQKSAQQSRGHVVKGAENGFQGKEPPIKLPLRRRLIRWLPLLGVVTVLIVTLLYLDVFDLRGMMVSGQETDPIQQVKVPADFVEERLKSAKAAVLLDSVPEPMDGALDLYVRDGLLYWVENGSVKTFDAQTVGGADTGGGSVGLKLSFQAGTSGLSFLMGRLDTTQYDMLRSVAVGQVRGETDRAYRVARLFFMEGDRVPVVQVEDLSVSLQLGEAFSLPETVRGILADGSAAEVPVNWSPSRINTAETGVLGSVGTVEGYSGTVTLTVIVGETLEASAETEGLAAGGTGQATVPMVADETPAEAPAAAAAAPAQVTAPAQTAVSAVKPVPVTIQALRAVTATVRQGEAYVMPTTVVAVMSDRSTRNVTVTWNPSSLDTGSAGTKVSSGSVSGSTQKATLTLTVTQSALAAPGVAVSKISGMDGTVRVTGKVGATVMFNEAAVGTIGSGGVLTVNGVNIDTLQTVRLMLEGWNPSPVVRTFVLF